MLGSRGGVYDVSFHDIPLHPDSNHNPNTNPDLNPNHAVICLKIEGQEMNSLEINYPVPRETG